MGAIHGFQHYINIASLCGAVDDTWQTVDISDYVPPQAEYALLYIKNTASAQYYFNVRPTGSGYNDEPDTGHAPRVYQTHQKFIIVKLDSSKQFDIRRSNANITVALSGWADGSIHYLTTRVDVTPVSSGWVETDLSAYIPVGATGAYFYIVNNLASVQSNGARENGSTNGYYATVHRSTKWLACGVDGDRKVELYRSNSTIYLMGYFVAPIHFLTNKIQTTLPAPKIWQDVSLTGKFDTNNVDFAFISLYPAAYNEGIGPSGGSGFSYGTQRGIGFCRVNVACDYRGCAYELSQLHFAEGWQETDTSRYQLEIGADVPDTYSPSELTYGSTEMGIRYLRKSFIHNGLFWAFYVKSTNRFYYRTSSDGLTWSDETEIQTTIYRYGEAAHIWFDGSKVHMFTKNTPLLKYRKGTPESDGTITWDAVLQTCYTASFPSTVADHSGAVDSSGYPWVAWCFATSGGGYLDMEIYVNGSQNNDGTWLDLAGYPKVITSNNYRVPYFIALANRNMYLFILRGGATPKGRFYTQSGDSWGAVETLSARNYLTTYNGDALESWAVSAVVDARDDIHIVFSDEDNNIVYVRRDRNSGTWMDETVLKAAHDFSTPSMSIDYDTGNLYVFCAEDDDHIYMLKRINWVWDSEWTDFLNMSDIGIGYDPTEGSDGCLSVSRRVIDNKVMVMVMGGNSPRTIRCKVLEIDKITFTWDGVSRSTPWTQSDILTGETIDVVMPATVDATYDWSKWSDGPSDRTREVTLTSDLALIGEYIIPLILLSLYETLQFSPSLTYRHCESLLDVGYKVVVNLVKKVRYKIRVRRRGGT